MKPDNQDQASAGPRCWRELDWPLFLKTLAALSFLVSVGTLLIFRVESAATQREAGERERARIERRVSMFGERIGDIVSDLRLVSNAFHLQRYLAEGKPDELAGLERELDVFVESKQIYDQARYIDERGMERVRVDLSAGRAKNIGADKLQNKGTRYFFTDTMKLREGEIFVSPLDLNIEGSQVEVPFKPMIRLATPLFDDKGERRGIAIVNYLATDLLRRLNTGEDAANPVIELLNRDGFWLKSADPTDEWGFMFNRPETFASRHPDIWKRMQSSPNGQVTADGAMWTWSRIYPLQLGMQSSSGSPFASAPSQAAVAAADYHWIAISRGTAIGSGSIALRYFLLWLAAMGLVALGSWMVALRQGRLNIANADLDRSNRQNEIIARFQQTFIDEPEPTVLFDKLLQDIIALTDSEFGLIADVLQDEAGRDYLKCYAFSNVAWDEATRRFYEENQATGFVFRNLDNLFGHVILDRAPVIANDPKQDPRHGGQPAGHPEIRAFLGIPVWYGDRLVGEIGLANRPGGYDRALLDQIGPVVAACGRIIVARWDRDARREAEREVGAAQRRIELLLESTGEGVCGVNLEGQVIFINRAARQMLGLAADEGMGIQLHERTHHRHADGSYFPKTECPIFQTKMDGQPRFVPDDWYWRKDGSGFPVEYTVAPIWQDDKIVGAVNIFRDISARKKAEAQLSETQSFNETIMLDSPVAMGIYRAAGPCVMANDAYAYLVGATREQLLAQNFREIKVWQESGLLDDCLGALTDGCQYRREIHTRTLSGAELWLDCLILPTILNGEPHLLLQFFDLTEIRQTTEAMREAQAKAEAANLAKSRFLATMSHEIRTPMNGILGMAQLLLMSKLSEEEQQEYARIIMNSGQALLTLLNDILDLSKIEAGRVELERLAFEPDQLIRDTATLFAEQAGGKWLPIETAWHGQANARYWGDPTRLRQMLSNLTGNAIKFTSKGFVRIEAREVAADGDDVMIEFSVTDSGIGIPESKRAQLFKPFSQADVSTTREYGGTGLGLSIVGNLARLMAGEVGVDSEEGKGSRFWFRVQASRLRESEESRLSERDAPLAPPDHLATQPSQATGRFVLVVEDNATNRAVVEALLKKQRVRFESVCNGQEAVSRITSGISPDLVLMDCQMPVMDGYEATRQIRQWERQGGRNRLPIIALTANAFDEDRQQCLAAGMDDFMSKPISIQNLKTALEKWLNAQ